MKFNEFIRKSKLTKKEKQIEHWIENYNNAYPKIKIIPIADAHEIKCNNEQIRRFKIKYPFYNKVIELNSRSLEEAEIRLGVVEEIINYLDIVYQNGNIIIQDGNIQSSSKRTYSIEKKRILGDLNMIIFEAVLFNQIAELKRVYYEGKKNKEVLGNRFNKDNNELSRPEIIDAKSNLTSEKEVGNVLEVKTILRIDESEFFEKLKLNRLINERFEWVGLGKGYRSRRTQLNILILLLENERKLISNLGDQAYLDYFGNKLTDFKPTRKQYLGKLRDQVFPYKKEINIDHNYYDCYSRLKELLF